jgi:mono/diheme cytochrome c family protein
MRYTVTFFMTITVSLLLSCQTGNKVAYVLPPDTPPDQKKELVADIHKGQALYKIYCTECHGVFAKAKDGVPDFTDIQIDNYSAKFLRHDPKNHAVTRKMSPEQMNDILMFLRYRKVKKAHK